MTHKLSVWDQMMVDIIGMSVEIDMIVEDSLPKKRVKFGIENVRRMQNMKKKIDKGCPPRVKAAFADLAAKMLHKVFEVDTEELK